MTVINTNIKALVAQSALRGTGRELAAAMQQLSTGKRINHARDDAAGLAVSLRMTAQVRGLEQSMRNANDGISLLQTTEGALIEVTGMLQRMRELAVQAANDTYSDDDRAALDGEYQQLMQEVNRIANNAEWNGMLVLNNAQDEEHRIGVGVDLAPELDGTEARRISFQVGTQANHTISLVLKDFSFSLDPAVAPPATSVFSGEARLNDTRITAFADASTAIARVDQAIRRVIEERGTFGSVINRLTYAGDNLTTVAQNTVESRSRIEDTDFARATSELSRTQILQQAATAVLAQANMDQQTVLKLLG